jgi:lactoylglutathione lyase
MPGATLGEAVARRPIVSGGAFGSTIALVHGQSVVQCILPWPPIAGPEHRQKREVAMNPDDFPAPKEGFVLSHFLVVSDQDRSRAFYQSLFDGQILIERDPVIMKVANSWLILNEGGGPTDDKPTVTLTTPADPNRTSAFLNVRVADIDKAYKDWSAKGVEFLTEPKDHGREIRAYIRDPDGHLIEVGQSVGAPD